MRKILITIAAAAVLMPARAVMAAGNPDEDRTPIAHCDSLPASASIEVFTAAETRTVCAEMLRILEEATIADVRLFSKAAFMLSVKGYESEKYAEITRELVEIIRLRSLYDNEPRWKPTLDIVLKTWEGEKWPDKPARDPRVPGLSRGHNPNHGHISLFVIHIELVRPEYRLFP